MSAITKHDAPRSPEGSRFRVEFEGMWAKFLAQFPDLVRSAALADIRHAAECGFFEGYLRGHKHASEIAVEAAARLAVQEQVRKVSRGFN